VGNSGECKPRAELGNAPGELPWVDIVLGRSENRTGFKFPIRRGNALSLVQELSSTLRKLRRFLAIGEAAALQRPLPNDALRIVVTE